jgi:hypothetical protein
MQGAIDAPVPSPRQPIELLHVIGAMAKRPLLRTG